MNLQELTLDYLKKNYSHIHYFGLGFIQIKLTKSTRVHFYTDLLPPIIDKEEIHNHRYDFTSTILSGTLTQETFTIIEGNTHTKQNESCKEGEIMKNTTAVECSAYLSSAQNFSESSNYFINHNTFHRVYSKNAITFLERSEYKKEFAEVLRPKDIFPTCPFSKKIAEKELWEIVKKMLKLAKTVTTV
jgi:hypothetical protein